MQSHCRECGAPIPTDATCQHNFHALLFRESEVSQMPIAPLPADSLQTAHFYAVSCYILQHPNSMEYTQAALREAHKNLAAHLNGETSLTNILEQLRRGQKQNPTRIRRHLQDTIPSWNVHTWPMNVADVLSTPATPTAYTDAVTRWASTILDTIEHTTENATEKPTNAQSPIRA